MNMHTDKLTISHLNSLCFFDANLGKECSDLPHMQYDFNMKDLLAPESNSIWHSAPSNNFPMVYLCSDMGKDSSALILIFLDLSAFPRYVVLRFVFHQIL